MEALKKKLKPRTTGLLAGNRTRDLRSEYVVRVFN